MPKRNEREKRIDKSKLGKIESSKMRISGIDCLLDEISKESGRPSIDVHVATFFAHVVHYQLDSPQFRSGNFAETLCETSWR